MAEEKNHNIKIDEFSIPIEELEIPEGMKSIWRQASSLPIKQLSNAMNQPTIQLRKCFEQISESFKGQFQILANTISNIHFPKLNIDFDKLKIRLYKNSFEEKRTVVDKLYEKTIFPPIYYIVLKDIEEKDIGNCEEWILNNKELKSFYINRIDKWENKYNDNNIRKMIEEIKFNFEHNNSYSIYTLIVILIEYMLRQNYSEEIKGTGKIYSSIKNILNEKVFKPIDIDKLYIRFIEENLYASTSKAKEFSRHITHGDKIELGNMKSAMNMIFIYDFLQDVMIVNKK
ncbi:putative dynein beta chain [Clostridium botulinum C str. Eklund]|nr:putative dynein beta chain [Clostridium botulinum C str. Eklund]